ncbi:hypothetical protein PPERSA_01521 [Pseudocohnilembus persalinus]|uniref:Pre-mRNA-splicing factor 38 n=1 Tax=Pseudocohnilembus persalinus TaxID=266149 RepID=A0A0V0R7M2_PSEPJ|nr:hypothetical protein PPERSA_01521 [Pseudocohnilembus persalinus]|eukprot:KRX10509.1 hypothetical protein PPERSA_01521 [Pseudocohnilembus persalinus]
MANRTVKEASFVRGTNPQYLIDKILRNKIYNCRYWKENCTGLTAESLVDEAIQLEYVSGSYGGFRQPSKFICLVAKMLQLSPEKEIVLEYMRNEDYKYVTALAMFYWRMIATTEECYKILEEYYSDYRKIRYRNEDGSFQIIHIDEFADDLLKKEVLCSTVLPHIQSRINLEEFNDFQPRISQLEHELEKELQFQEEYQDNMELDNQSQKGSRSNSVEKKKKKKHKKHKKHRNRSDDEQSRSRSRSHKKKSKKKWRKVVSGKYKRSHSKDKDQDNYKQQNQKEVEPQKGSIEAENKMRAELGIPLLPTN